MSVWSKTKEGMHVELKHFNINFHLPFFSPSSNIISIYKYVYHTNKYTETHQMGCLYHLRGGMIQGKVLVLKEEEKSTHRRMRGKRTGGYTVRVRRGCYTVTLGAAVPCFRACADFGDFCAALKQGEKTSC